MAEAVHLIFSLIPLPSPPKPTEASLPVKPQNGSKTPRRSASFLLLSLAALVPSSFATQCPSAAAFSLGISGPKEWLRDQKKKASRFLLAPIEASRNSLRTAHLLLTSNSGSPVEDSGEVRKLLNSATRDCVLEDRNSIVAFQARTGVEVCTFRLIVKNAASLLDDSDPLKLEADAMLGELIRSFTSLGSIVYGGDLQLASDRQKVEDGLMDAISSLDKFEQRIKDCLGV